jgi:hypothetical protein
MNQWSKDVKTTQADPNYVPTGKIYKQHERIALEYVKNGEKQAEAYTAIMGVTNTAPQAASRLFKKPYMKELIEDFETEAFEASIITASWGISEMKSIVKLAKKDKRYKEAIVAIVETMKLAGLYPQQQAALGSGDNSKKDGYVYVMPKEVPEGTPVAQVEDTHILEAKFQESEEVEVTEQDVESAEEQIKDV